METPRGEIDLHVRALQGFPDDEDSGFGFFDPQYATAEVVLRFTPREDDAGASRFLCFRRSLADFVHLEQRLQAETHETQTTAGNTSDTVEQLAAQYAAALSRPQFVPRARQTERLMGRLDLALSTMLARARRSLCLETFFGHHIVRSEEHASIVQRFLAHNEAIEETSLAAGCSSSHDVVIDQTTAALPSLVVWKFAYEGDVVDFSVEFRPDSEPANAIDPSADVNPYSEAAVAWSGGVNEETDAGRVVLQYTTRYTKELDGSEWIYGASVVPAQEDKAGGVVTLEWANGDDASIFSKLLRWQTRVCCVGDGMELSDLMHLGGMASGEFKEDIGVVSLAWLENVVASSPVTNWSYHAGQSTAFVVALDEPQIVVDVNSTESSQPNGHQVRELEMNVFKLEEELQNVRQELRSTRSELEISSEIYKASLETIAHLETAPARVTSNGLSNGTHANGVNGDEDEDSYGEDVFGSDDDDDDGEQEPSDTENNRLRDLVATFQEQCLWRSIETTESEKRGLLLEMELTRVDQEKQSLAQQLAARDVQLEQAQAENSRLKAQKTVLVKEVKRLQPYSQVNLSALIREAEEARMMQRSLQAQLQALIAANAPESDHPVSPPIE